MNEATNALGLLIALIVFDALVGVGLIILGAVWLYSLQREERACHGSGGRRRPSSS